MSISSPFIQRPIATSLLMAAIFLVGLAAYPLLPVAPLPQVDFPTLTITAQYPGASPETMAESVAEPLETQFAQISGVAQMTSMNVLGTSTITLQFDLSRNIDAASTDVLEAINAAQGQLPKNLPSQPTIRKINPADAPIMILSVQSDDEPLTTVDDYAENILSQRLSQVSGVSQVLVGGQQKPSIRVQIDPGKLASMGLTLEDVRTVLTDATVDEPKGSIDGPNQSYTVMADDQLTKPAPYNNIVVAWRNGAPVRIGDIGRAIRGPQNRELAAWQNAKRGVLLVIFKQAGANVIGTVGRVQAELPALEAAIPPRDPCAHHRRSHADDPRLGQRRRVHAGAVDRPRRDGDLPVPAQRLGDADLLRHRAARTGRHARRDVRARLQPRQPLADGLDDRGRLRRRRRDRDAGEHLSPRRGRHVADGGGGEGRGRDRLHHRVDQSFPRRGVHPAAADERHRRPAVPRIRDDGLVRRAALGVHLADLDADDVLALPQAAERPARLAVSHRRGRLRLHPRVLSPHAGDRAALPVHHAAGVPGDRRADRRALHHHPEGLLPDAGHRPDRRGVRRPAGRLVRPTC